MEGNNSDDNETLTGFDDLTVQEKNKYIYHDLIKCYNFINDTTNNVSSDDDNQFTQDMWMTEISKSESEKEHLNILTDDKYHMNIINNEKNINKMFLNNLKNDSIMDISSETSSFIVENELSFYCIFCGKLYHQIQRMTEKHLLLCNEYNSIKEKLKNNIKLSTTNLSKDLIDFFTFIKDDLLHISMNNSLKLQESNINDKKLSQNSVNKSIESVKEIEMVASFEKEDHSGDKINYLNNSNNNDIDLDNIKSITNSPKNEKTENTTNDNNCSTNIQSPPNIPSQNNDKIDIQKKLMLLRIKSRKKQEESHSKSFKYDTDGRFTLKKDINGYSFNNSSSDILNISSINNLTDPLSMNDTNRNYLKNLDLSPVLSRSKEINKSVYRNNSSTYKHNKENYTNENYYHRNQFLNDNIENDSEICPHCHRSFAKGRSIGHQKVCQRIFSTSNNNTPKKLIKSVSMSAQTPHEKKFNKVNVSNATPHSKEINYKKIDPIRNNISKKKLGMLDSYLDHQKNLIKCPHCERKFAPSGAQQHINICKTVENKPKTLFFYSSGNDYKKRTSSFVRAV